MSSLVVADGVAAHRKARLEQMVDGRRTIERLGCVHDERVERSIRTGMPLRIDIPATASKSATSPEASTFEFTPPARLARCQPPLWPQPWASAMFPGVISSLMRIATLTEPLRDVIVARSPSLN